MSISTGEVWVRDGQWLRREVTGEGRGRVDRILSRTQPPATRRVLEGGVGVDFRRVKRWSSEEVRLRVLGKLVAAKSWEGLLWRVVRVLLPAKKSTEGYVAERSSLRRDSII